MATKTKKSEAPKNVLAPLRIASIQKALKKGDIPTILVEGDYPSRYNEAAAIKKSAEELMIDLKPVMLPSALAELFRNNADRPWDAISSVKLQDAAQEVTRVTFMNKYSNTTAPVVEALFGEIKKKDGKRPDINDYCTRSMVGKFNSAAFQGPDGKFSQERYDEIREALAEVSIRLGIENPLSTEEVVQVLPDFNSRRWMDFDEKTNARITEVIPNQINFVPCPRASDEAAE
ncbi:MAG: hypothetical protein JZU63_07775 [Rhodoferax sp.]|nr:hypothetical protein [Rhodoferax sp.]